MKYFFTTRIHSTFLLVVIFISFHGFSQETAISPYSRIGLGGVNLNHSPAYQALGGASVALSDFNLVNTSNPASLSYLDMHMPVFELSGATQLLKLTSENSSADLSTTNFTRMSIGIPVNKRLGLAFGIKPYTTTGYNITTTNTEANIGDVSYKFQGKGGVNNLFLSGGYSLLDKDSINLSLGASVNFLFGNIEKSRRVEFPDDASALNSLLTQKTGYNGVNFQLGLLYKQKINKNLVYTLGASFDFGTTLSAKREDFLGTYTDISAVEVIRDTLSYFNNNEGEVAIPSLIRIGASVLLYETMEFSVQYQRQDWSTYNEKFDQQSTPDTLSNSSFLSFGIRYTPSDVFSTATYYERIQYRAGIRAGQSPLQFNNTQLTEFGTSFGIGLPLRKNATSKNEFRSLSMLNFGVEFGNRGQIEGGLIRENFTTIYFGISIMPQVQNRWFVKRKFK
jgi:hypothetical protein